MRKEKIDSINDISISSDHFLSYHNRVHTVLETGMNKKWTTFPTEKWVASKKRAFLSYHHRDLIVIVIDCP